jgi:hypothetical protein
MVVSPTILRSFQPHRGTVSLLSGDIDPQHIVKLEPAAQDEAGRRLTTLGRKVT